MGQFHKWSNKGYGIYNSLKRVVRIGVVPIAYSLLAMPMATFAQSDTVTVSRNVDIDEVIVNANRKASTYSELTRAVKVVSREELGQLPATSLHDALERVAGIDVRQRGSHGVQADMNFRGGTFDQTLILINGINMTDPQTGHHNLNLPIGLNSIQRIEILQGPGARDFGPGAFSGAINIITEPDNQNKVNLSANAGEHGLIESNISSTIVNGGTRTFVSSSFGQSNGYTNNTDFRVADVFFHSKTQAGIGAVSLFAGYQSKEFGANSFYSTRFPDQFEKTNTLLTALQIERSWSRSRWRVEAYTRQHRDHFELFRNRPNSRNHHTSGILGIRTGYTVLTRLGRTQAGIEFRNEEIMSSNLGDSMVERRKVPGEFDAYYYKWAGRKIFNASANHTMYFNRITISGGVLFNFNSKFDENWGYGLDFGYLLSDHFKLYASVNQAFRNPTFTDLYYFDGSRKGNTDLRPEEAITYECGIKYNAGKVRASAGYFLRNGRNTIDWVMFAGDTLYRSYNHSNLITSVIEGSVQFDLREWIPLFNSIWASYSHIWSSGTSHSQSYQSLYALDYLNHNLSLGVNHTIYKRLNATWGISWQDRNDYFDVKSGSMVNYPSFWVVDAKLQWIAAKYTVFIGVSNILDEEYHDIAGVQQPGRWISLGFNYNFLW